jgi:hypothetical protein
MAHVPGSLAYESLALARDGLRCRVVELEIELASCQTTCEDLRLALATRAPRPSKAPQTSALLTLIGFLIIVVLAGAAWRLV